MNNNKHNYLGERGKANILLSATVDDVFSITLEDEDNGVKSSWEMIMYRDAAEKVARKFAEMLGIIPVECKRDWGKWVISEIQCPNCLEYFQTDCYSTEELKKCPTCSADMRRGAK